MKSNLLKKILVRHVLPMMISISISLVFSLVLLYFQEGIPLVSDLQNRTDIISVQIIQGNETVLLTDSKDIQQAVLFARVLRYRFGKAEGGQADVMYVFTFKDGTKMELGANSTTVFKNGKQYRGNSDFCQFFIKCTQGMFFHSHAAEKENLYK